MSMQEPQPRALGTLSDWQTSSDPDQRRRYAQRAVDQWNDRIPSGAEVIFRNPRDGASTRTYTRSPAFLFGTDVPAIHLMSRRDSPVTLDCVEAVLADPRTAPEVPDGDCWEGVCALCGQVLLLTSDDCWHPWSVERACPPEPADGNWQEWYNAGNRPGRPGRQHWEYAVRDLTPREVYGELVRKTWVEWAREQPDPKPSWLVGWDQLDDDQREVDMRIGQAVAVAVLIAAGDRMPHTYSREAGFGQDWLHEQAERLSRGETWAPDRDEDD